MAHLVNHGTEARGSVRPEARGCVKASPRKGIRIAYNVVVHGVNPRRRTEPLDVLVADLRERPHGKRDPRIRGVRKENKKGQQRKGRTAPARRSHKKKGEALQAWMLEARLDPRLTLMPSQRVSAARTRFVPLPPTPVTNTL